MKLTHHEETEYDFALTFLNTPAPRVGEEVKSGVRDDDGQSHYFNGTALVVATTKQWRPDEKTIVYIKSYDLVE